MKFLNVIYFWDTGLLWRPALELNGLTCESKVLLYFIASQHCKRRQRKRIREFHSYITSTVLLSNTSSSRILNYSRTTPRLPLCSHNLPSPHTKAKSCKNCPFIFNTDRTSGLKRFIRITDRFWLNVTSCFSNFLRRQHSNNQRLSW